MNNICEMIKNEDLERREKQIENEQNLINRNVKENINNEKQNKEKEGEDNNKLTT